MDMITLNKKFKTYSIRLSEEEWEMLNVIRKKIDLPSMLRKHIREIYGEINKKRNIDDKIYKM